MRGKNSRVLAGALHSLEGRVGVAALSDELGKQTPDGRLAT